MIFVVVLMMLIMFFLLDVYSAGEEPIQSFESTDLEIGLSKYGHKNISYIKDKKTLIKTILKLAQPNDLIICLGAGSITKIANKLEDDLYYECRNIKK
jgi:UDP-N-acetylmuramate--alanine ligase